MKLKKFWAVGRRTFTTPKSVNDISSGPVAADNTITDWCVNEPGYVLRVGNFNDDYNADLLCDDTVIGELDYTFKKKFFL